MSTDGFFVEEFHRPRRVAFLVDVEQAPDQLFDEIVDFNVCSWGGRFNPVIPVVDGKITDSYWRLLKLVDPDQLYVYCDLEPGVTKQVFADLGPLKLERHRTVPGQPPRFHVQIDNQATIVPLLRRIIDTVPAYARKPEPAVLDFKEGDHRRLSSFVRRNFGGGGQFHIWCRDQGIPRTEAPPDDRDVMAILASNRNLIMPIQVSGKMPRRSSALTNEWGNALTLYYGSSPWNFADYWNSVHFSDLTHDIHRSLSEMWVRPDVLDDKFVYEAFLELLRRRTFISDQHNYLRLVSYDQDEQHMRQVAQQICSDFRWNMHPGEPVVRRKGELPAFERRGTSSFFGQMASRSQQVTGSRGFLQLEPPAGFSTELNRQWIAEFAVEKPAQERYIANRAAWWKLPRKPGIAELFVPESTCRVSADHLISVEVSAGQQGLLLRTPELRVLFSALLLPQRHPRWLQEVDSTEERRYSSLDVRTSDKGMYARGVLGLFQSLQEAAYVFEHPFWRGVIESLSSARSSEHVREKVQKDLQRLEISEPRSADGIEKLVDEVLDAAGRIQRTAGRITFGRLVDRYDTYLKTLDKEEMLSELTEIIHDRLDDSDQKAVRGRVHRHLRLMLSELTSRRVFLQGAEIQCDHCLASLWYHVDDMRSTVVCRGCRKSMDLPAEVAWSYSLNELVAAAVREHGIVPVIRTIYRIFASSRECFCFLPGLEVRDYLTEPESQVCELDLVWINDGEFGVAEVKGTSRKLSVKRNLATLVNRAPPDRFLLASVSGSREEMGTICAKAKVQLDPRINVEGWGTEHFDHNEHIGWGTFRYALM